jgi:hypothetical protein
MARKGLPSMHDFPLLPYDPIGQRWQCIVRW